MEGIILIVGLRLGQKQKFLSSERLCCSSILNPAFLKLQQSEKGREGRTNPRAFSNIRPVYPYPHSAIVCHKCVLGSNDRSCHDYMNVAIAVQDQLTLTPFAIIGSCERSQFFRAISVLKHFVR
jgi:hypothetical protein